MQEESQKVTHGPRSYRYRLGLQVYEIGVARPGLLTRGPRTRSYRVLINREAWRMGKISRASVADFFVKQIDDNTCLGKAPLLIN